LINIVSYKDNEEGLYWGVIFREVAYIWNEVMLIHRGGGFLGGAYIGGGGLYAEVYGIQKQEKTIDRVAMANIT
jgi:hypothetical protein